MLKVNSVAFSPEGNYFISASDDRSIKLWNAESHKEVITLIGHSDCVSSVMFSPNGKYIVSGSKDCTFKLWSI
jgi:WD40 repeat protein